MNWLDFTLIGSYSNGNSVWNNYRSSLADLPNLFSCTSLSPLSLLLHKLLSSIIKEIFSPKVSSILGYAVIFGITLVVTYAVGNLFRKFLTKRKFGMSGRLIGGGISFTKNRNNVLCDYSRGFILGKQPDKGNN